MTAQALIADRAPTLDERVAAGRSAFTPGETVVAQFFLDHREDVAFLSAAVIAEHLEVSDATVIRTAQTLGYSGLPELKQELQDAMRSRRRTETRYDRSIDELGADAALLHEHIAGQIQLLEQAERSVGGEQFERAVSLLAGADRIVACGFGPNRHLIDFFVQSIRRLGWNATAITSRDAHLEDGALVLRPGDAVLLVAYEVVIPEVAIVADSALDEGTPLVLVTDNLALALAGRYDTALTARRGRTEAAPTVTVPLVVLEALVFGIAAENRGRMARALQRLRALRETLDGA